MERSEKRPRIDGGGYSVVPTLNFRGSGNSLGRIAIRDCDDHLTCVLIGTSFVGDGSVIVQGHGIRDEVARRCSRVVKLPPVLFNIPKNMSLNMSLDQAKEQIRTEFDKFHHSSSNQLAPAKPKSSGMSVDRLLLDTGATHHFCTNRAMFSTYKPLTLYTSARSANGTTSNVVGIGYVVLKMTSGSTLMLENVRHVPDFRSNFVSASQLTTRSFKLEFETNKVVLTRNGEFVGNGSLVDNLFILDAIVVHP